MRNTLSLHDALPIFPNQWLWGEMFVKKPTSAYREVIKWVIQRWDSLSFAKFLLMLLKRSDIWNQFWTSWWLFSSETHSLLKTLKGSGSSLVVQLVKNPPEVQETWVQSLGREDPLEEGMATHSSILAWRIPMDRGSLVGYSPWGHKEPDTTEQLTFRFSGDRRSMNMK